MTPEARGLALEAFERLLKENSAALSRLASSDYEPYESDKPSSIQEENN
jgi:hypothetical protein